MHHLVKTFSHPSQAFVELELAPSFGLRNSLILLDFVCARESSGAVQLLKERTKRSLVLSVRVGLDDFHQFLRAKSSASIRMPFRWRVNHQIDGAYGVDYVEK